MDLHLKPLSVPFMIGDVVFINQPYNDKAERQSFFMGEIIQIILDGTLHVTSVVRDREAVHELTISNAIYDIKPLGDYTGQPRASIQIGLVPLDEILFESEEKLLEHRSAGQSTAKEEKKQ